LTRRYRGNGLSPHAGLPAAAPLPLEGPDLVRFQRGRGSPGSDAATRVLRRQRTDKRMSRQKRLELAPNEIEFHPILALRRLS